MLIGLGFVSRSLKRVSNGNYVLSICFHHPTRDEFEKTVQWLIKRNFNFLKVSDLEQALNQGQPLPKQAVIITVDDGWSSNMANIVDVANQYKVPVTIFVSTLPVEEGNFWWSYVLEAKARKIPSSSLKALKKVKDEKRREEIDALKKQISLKPSAMSLEQLKMAAASEYITIGAHTHSHPILVNCTDSALHQELQVSKAKLEAWLGKPVPYFAYPNGDYGQREINALSILGYKLAFSTNQKPLDNQALKDNFQLPRFMFLEGASFAENICRLTGVWKPLSDLLRLKSTKPGTNASSTSRSSQETGTSILMKVSS